MASVFGSSPIVHITNVIQYVCTMKSYTCNVVTCIRLLYWTYMYSVVCISSLKAVASSLSESHIESASQEFAE